MSDSLSELRVWGINSEYRVCQMTPEQISPYLKEWQPKVFGEEAYLIPLWSNSEKAATETLRAHMGKPLQLAFGVFKGETFVGWHVGNQRSGLEFYMRNSAILPEHRGQGLYSALSKIVVAYLLELGFQEITSRHSATNNAVIVPKLKQGFVITSLEVSDIFGVLVHLVYYAKESRREALEFRVGTIRPNERILQDIARGHS